MAHASVKRSGPYRTLKRSFASAKRERAAAGRAWKKAHTGSNRARYRAAEMEWQSTGAALGRLTGTHKPRHARTSLKIHSPKFRSKRRISLLKRSR